jgi:hypothetical protein
MKPLSISKFALVLLIPLIAISCIKDNKEQPIGCEPRPLVVLPFNVLDASTKQDLFFSATPRYAISSLYLFRKKDKARKDTIRPIIFGPDTNRVFTVPVTNGVAQDTLLMHVGTNPDDVIIYTIKNQISECSSLTLDKVFFNGTQIISSEGRFNFTK